MPKNPKKPKKTSKKQKDPVGEYLKFVNKQEQEQKRKKELEKPKKSRKERFLDAYRVYGIICNNSVYGGDCYGDTMCTCKCYLYDKNYSMYYKGPPPSYLHHDHQCTQCQVKVCGCCFSEDVCVICEQDEFMVRIQDL